MPIGFDCPRAGAAGQGGDYVIENAALFDGTSGYFSRTQGTCDSRRVFTQSFWVKVADVGTSMTVMATYTSSGPSGQRNWLQLDANGNWYWYDNDGSITWNRTTDPQHRDPSGWGHVLVAVDTNDSTAEDRTKLYWNGARVVDWLTIPTTTVTADTELTRTGVPLQIGAYNAGALFDGYMAEAYFIDGQALTPSDFGETTNDGFWVPKLYEGTYGSEGWYLDFSNASDLGEDQSGNNNDFTKNGTITQVTDVPTDSTAKGVGNFATLDPLSIWGRSATPVLSNGNLTGGGGSNYQAQGTTLRMESGKFTCQFTCAATAAAQFGVFGPDSNESGGVWTGDQVVYQSNGNKTVSGTSTAYGASWTTETIVCELDIDGGTVEFYKDGATQGSITLPSNVDWWVFGFRTTDTGAGTIDCGQNGFTALDSTFNLCNTANIPRNQTGKLSDHFKTVTYTGTGVDSVDITSVGFQSAMIWVKNRSNAASHLVYNAPRGFDTLLGIATNGTGKEGDAGDNLTNGYIDNVDADGFTVRGTGTYTNTNNDNYVAWCIKATDTGSSNTDGSITVSSGNQYVNDDLGFSITEFTGTAANATVGHGLSSAPFMVIVKNLTAANNWAVYHEAVGATKYLALQSTAAAATYSAAWNDTAPTSTVVSLGSDTMVNGATDMIMYCFRETDFCKPISGTENGNSNGVFFNLAGQPKWFMAKSSNSGGSTYDWLIGDTVRDPYNPMSKYLRANESTAEATGASYADAVSNGLKQRDSITSFWNVNTSTPIGVAFVEPEPDGTPQLRAR